MTNYFPFLVITFNIRSTDWRITSSYDLLLRKNLSSHASRVIRCFNDVEHSTLMTNLSSKVNRLDHIRCDEFGYVFILHESSSSRVLLKKNCLKYFHFQRGTKISRVTNVLLRKKQKNIGAKLLVMAHFNNIPSSHGII